LSVDVRANSARWGPAFGRFAVGFDRFAGCYNPPAMNPRPVILAIGGHDPTGGAGIQADIETITALGGRAVTLVTALTAQDTSDVDAVWPTPPPAFRRQLQRLLDDIRPAAVKIGMLGAGDIIEPLTGLLGRFDGPVVFDPVLAAGGGRPLADATLVQAVSERLLPRTTLLTPNRAEARRLTGMGDPAQAARALLTAGVRAVLLTGADEATSGTVVNELYTADGTVTPFAWPLLPNRYHGSGCTLASACATRLALGDALPTAVRVAQDFTWQALQQGQAVGHGQWLPERLR